MLSEQFEELSRYLPRDIYMGDSLEYAAYHARAISINGENNLYTIEYFALHILWMSFLEKITFQLYKENSDNVKLALGNDGVANRILEHASSLYDLSEIKEKKLCEIAKHQYIGYHGNQISNLKELVDKRDHVAHCSGVLDLDQDDILHYAKKCIRYTKDIHAKTENVILKNWDDFLSSINGNDAQYSLVHDAVIEFLSNEYISVADIITIIENRPLLDSTKDEADFRSNLARLQLALIVEDYDLECGIEWEIIANDIVAQNITDEQQSIVKDETEAYIRFRMGLAK